MATEQERNKAVVLKMFEEMWNNGNLDLVDEILAEDFVDYPPKRYFTTPLQGRESLYDAVKGFREGMSNFHFEMLRMTAEGNRVFYLGRATGTHDGNLFGAPASGKQVNVVGINEFHLENGKIVERWGVFDVLGMMQQIGMIPSGPGGH